MHRSTRLMLTLTTAACATAAATAGIPTDAFVIRIADGRDWKIGYLNAIDGKLTLGERPSAERWSHPTGPGCWHVAREGKPDEKLYRISSPTAKKCLTYDATGAEPRVLLLEEPGENAAWKLETDPTPRAVERESSIRVPTGKFAGYVLGVETKEEEVEGKKVVVRQLVLAKEPKSKLLVSRLFE